MLKIGLDGDDFLQKNLVENTNRTKKRTTKNKEFNANAADLLQHTKHSATYFLKWTFRNFALKYDALEMIAFLFDSLLGIFRRRILALIVHHVTVLPILVVITQRLCNYDQDD